MEEEPTKPEPLEYETPDLREPWKPSRELKLAIAIVLPPLLLCLWAYFGGRWLQRQPSYQNGGSFEAFYEPIFFDGPMCLGTVYLIVVAMFVAAMVARLWWRLRWLAAIPIIVVVWLFLSICVLGIQDDVFP